MSDTVYIIDSYGLIYRAYFAFAGRPLTNKKGENVSAVMGFFRNLYNVIRDYDCKYLAAAFDSRTPTFRHQMYPEYKATRDATPEDLHAQVPMIEDILSAWGVPVLRKDGFEADDIIATVAARCQKEGLECRILSGDKDLMQLVTDTTLMLKPDKTGGWAQVDKNGVFDQWGVFPDRMLDLLSLTGDTADNVPGVKGIGEKTAAKLISTYESLDGIYQAADTIKGSMGEKIRTGKDQAYFSKELIALRYDVPVEYTLESLTTASLNWKAAADALNDKGVFSVAKNFATKAVELGETAGQLSLFADEPAAKAKKEPAKKTATEKTEETAEPEAAEIIQNKGDYHPVRTLQELSDFVDKALSAGTAGFDTETDSLNAHEAHLAGFSLSVEKGTGIYVPLHVTDSLLAGDLIPKKDALAQLERLFSAPEMTVVLHNAKYDLEVLYAQGFDAVHAAPQGIRSAKIVDTMIAAWLLQSDRSETGGKNSYSLENLAETKLHLKGTDFEEIVPKGGIFADLDIDTATPYAAEDADFTLQLWKYYRPVLETEKLSDLFFNTEMPVLFILAQMEIEGIRLEKQRLYDYGAELKTKLSAIEQEIYTLAGTEFNIASPKQLGTILFENLALPHGKKTKSGWSTDVNVLEDLARIHPLPGKILEYRSSAKLLSTYVETLPELTDRNSRIHTSFLQHGTATGRLSSKDPNLQNIPVRDENGRRIRHAFVAPEGRILVSADYSQIELVLLAHLSGDQNMQKAFTAGDDIHRSTAALIYGVPQAEVTSEMRRTAKTINFGVMYGMSAFRLSNELQISRSQADEFIKSYFATYSGITQFEADTVAKAEETGTVSTILGRRRTISGINNRNQMLKKAAERMAVNTPIQGSAADVVKTAMIAVDAALKEKFPDARLLLQVHDELICECNESDGAAVAELMKQTMENAVTLSVPLRVSVEYGKSWGEFH